MNRGRIKNFGGGIIKAAMGEGGSERGEEREEVDRRLGTRRGMD